MIVDILLISLLSKWRFWCLGHIKIVSHSYFADYCFGEKNYFSLIFAVEIKDIIVMSRLKSIK